MTLTKEAEALLALFTFDGGHIYGSTREKMSDRLAAIEAAVRTEQAAEVERLRGIIDRLIDDEPCRFDHHGGCQTHGFLEPDPDEPWPCGVAEARAALTATPVAPEADR